MRNLFLFVQVLAVGGSVIVFGLLFEFVQFFRKVVKLARRGRGLSGNSCRGVIDNIYQGLFFLDGQHGTRVRVMRLLFAADFRSSDSTVVGLEGIEPRFEFEFERGPTVAASATVHVLRKNSLADIDVLCQIFLKFVDDFECLADLFDELVVGTSSDVLQDSGFFVGSNDFSSFARRFLA